MLPVSVLGESIVFGFCCGIAEAAVKKIKQYNDERMNRIWLKAVEDEGKESSSSIELINFEVITTTIFNVEIKKS